MKKQQSYGTDIDVKDYDFLIQFQAIKCKQRFDGEYSVQLEKGSQILHSVPQQIFLGRQQEYIFKDREQFRIKAFKQKQMVFDLSLYKKKSKSLEYFDSFKINLQSSYNKYINELQPFYLQYKQITKEKSPKSKCKSWRKLKQNLPSHLTKHVTNSKDGNFTIFCTIQIKNELDNLIDQQASNISNVNKEKQVSTSFSDKSAGKKSPVNKKKSMVVQKTQQLHRLKKSQSLIKIANFPKDFQKQEQANNQNYFLPISSQLGPKSKVKTALSHIIEASNETDVVYFSDKKEVEEETMNSNFQKNKSLSYLTRYDDEVIRQQEEVPQPSEQIFVHQKFSEESLQKSSIKISTSLNLKYILLFMIVYFILCGLLLKSLRQTSSTLKKTKKPMKKQRLF